MTFPDYADEHGATTLDSFADLHDLAVDWLDEHVRPHPTESDDWSDLDAAQDAWFDWANQRAAAEVTRYLA